MITMRDMWFYMPVILFVLVFGTVFVVVVSEEINLGKLNAELNTSFDSRGEYECYQACSPNKYFYSGRGFFGDCECGGLP